jgi:hypothetical protein
MIIYNLNIFGTFRRSPEANAELVVDPDAPLAFPVAAQRFQPVAGRHTHVVQVPRQIKLNQLAKRLTFNPRPPTDMSEPEQLFGFAGTERSDHPSIVTKFVVNAARYYFFLSAESHSFGGGSRG